MCDNIFPFFRVQSKNDKNSSVTPKSVHPTTASTSPWSAIHGLPPLDMFSPDGSPPPLPTLAELAAQSSYVPGFSTQSHYMPGFSTEEQQQEQQQELQLHSQSQLHSQAQSDGVNRVLSAQSMFSLNNNLSQAESINQLELINKTSVELRDLIFIKDGSSNVIISLLDKLERMRLLIDEWKQIDGNKQILKQELLSKLENEWKNHKLNLLYNLNQSFKANDRKQVDNITAAHRVDKISQLIEKIEATTNQHQKQQLEDELEKLYDECMCYKVFLLL